MWTYSHAQLNPIKPIVWICSTIGQLQLSEYTWWWVNRFIGRNMSCYGTIGGAVTTSTSGNRATGWPLYVTSNNKLRQQHSTKMFSVDSCQFTSGPYHLSDTPLFRPLGRMRTPPPAGPAPPAGLCIRPRGRTMKRLRNDMDPKWTDSCLWSQYPFIIQTWKKVSKACKSVFENSTPCKKGFAHWKNRL